MFLTTPPLCSFLLCPRGPERCLTSGRFRSIFVERTVLLSWCYQCRVDRSTAPVPAGKGTESCVFSPETQVDSAMVIAVAQGH